MEQYFPTYVIHKHAHIGSTIQDVNEWDVSNCQGIPTILLIGTNNFGHPDSTDIHQTKTQKIFNESYTAFVTKINADPLLAISILPRNKDNKEDSTANILIQKANKSIVNILESNVSYYKYINVYDQFIYSGYIIRKDLFKDGLHPNKAGYEILAEEIGKVL